MLVRPQPFTRAALIVEVRNLKHGRGSTSEISVELLKERSAVRFT
jgi:hypothetical protein